MAILKRTYNLFTFSGDLSNVKEEIDVNWSFDENVTFDIKTCSRYKQFDIASVVRTQTNTRRNQKLRNSVSTI